MKNSFILLLLIGSLITLMCTGLLVGSLTINGEILYDFLLNFDVSNTNHYVLLNVRMPRILLAVLVGALLSISGYLAQLMFNNPLADPYILGTASGASIGANLVNVGWVPSVFAGFAGASVLGFIGALLFTFLSAVVAYDHKKINPTKLLLTGVAMSSLGTAIVSLFTFLAEDQQHLRSILFWIMGSFDRAVWSYIPVLLVILLVILFFLQMYKDHIMLLILGESRAIDLGLNIQRLRWYLLVLIALMVAVCVATAGPIGFVGLIIPHLIRGMFGVSGKYNLFYTALVGGIFMLACDLLARIVYPPVGMPIGIITSLCGIPFFFVALK
jgi:iron complex transport system permease protein